MGGSRKVVTYTDLNGEGALPSRPSDLVAYYADPFQNSDWRIRYTPGTGAC